MKNSQLILNVDFNLIFFVREQVMSMNKLQAGSGRKYFHRFLSTKQSLFQDYQNCVQSVMWVQELFLKETVTVSNHSMS